MNVARGHDRGRATPIAVAVLAIVTVAAAVGLARTAWPDAESPSRAEPRTVTSTTVSPSGSRSPPGARSPSSFGDPTAVDWPGSPRRVLFIGDSLSVETAPFLDALLAADGDTLVHIGFHGTAICDWMPDLEAQLSGSTPPDVVVAMLSGNALSPCMTSRVGGAAGIVDDPSDIARTPEYRDAWRADTAALVARTEAASVPLALVASPASRSFSERNPGERPYVDGLYRAAASASGRVAYVDLDEMLTPGGGFAASLPCVTGEPDCAAGAVAAVRADDGGHFCDPGRFCHGGWRAAVMIRAQVRPR